MPIDLNKPLELVHETTGEKAYWTPTVIGPLYNGGLVAIKWGSNDVMCSVFHTHDGSYESGENLDGYVLRNVRDDFSMSLRELIDEGRVDTDEGTVSFYDGRYDYVVYFNRDKGNEDLPYMTAGCRRWTHFSQAYGHYDYGYMGTGDRELCQKIIDRLDDLWYEFQMNKSNYPELDKPKTKLVNGVFDITDGGPTCSKSYVNSATVEVSVAEWGSVFLTIHNQVFNEKALSDLIDDLTAIRDAKFRS